MADAHDDWRYRVPGREMARWGASLTGAGRERVLPGQAYPVGGVDAAGVHALAWERGRTLPFLQVIAITSGAGRFDSTPSRGIALAAGDALLLIPGIRHRYRPDPRVGWTASWIELHGPVPERLVAEGAILATQPCRPAAATPELVHRLDALISDALDPAADAGRLACDGLAVLAHVVGASREGDADQHDRARELLRSGVGGRAAAAACGLSYATFRRRFAVQCGMPPHRWALRQRLALARGRLMSGASVAVAAEAAGFTDPGYFSRCFRSAFGCPPSAVAGGR